MKRNRTRTESDRAQDSSHALNDKERESWVGMMDFSIFLAMWSQSISLMIVGTRPTTDPPPLTPRATFRGLNTKKKFNGVP
jgi:hypothetical protein